MANTFELISSTTVGLLGASSISFTSIPSTYTDLVVKMTARSTVAANNEDITMAINSQSAGSWRVLYGTGAAVGSTSSGTFSFVAESNGATTTSNTFANIEIYIPNYTSSNVKVVTSDNVTENNATDVRTLLNVTSMTNGTAISSITFTPAVSGSFVQYSTAYLYGVKNA
jgi:hypothetical protein